MLQLILASGFFLIIHLLIAGTQLRDHVVQSVGEQAYLGLFSLASAFGIFWLATSYNQAALEPSDPLWYLGEGVKHAGGLVVLIAALFIVSGVLTPNPTSVGMEKLASKPEVATGVLRITRHPFLWGVALWATFHLAANGDAPSVIFFGTFALLAILGTFSIDAKRRRRMKDDWQTFAQKTSNIPFGAILGGRNRIAIGELMTFRQLLAVLVFAALILSHHWLFGVSPFPGGWVPF
ncbi:MAG: NnrU family protein [Micropepsaceae bacterium]